MKSKDLYTKVYLGYTMETTIKIHKETKQELDALKEGNESYNEVIATLVSQSKKKNMEKELIEGYKSRGKEELELLKEWEAASPELEEW